MASSKEVGGESVTGYDDEDIRGDSKKKKFKPLSAMKKFFTKKRGEKKETVVAIKAKSTTALHSGYRTDEDEDDDDGGFRPSSHAKPILFAPGNRSLSEDSVFSPEQKGPSIPTFPKSAVSEESLPKSAFQSELLSKLNQRRHQSSDDYHDEGLPRSPVPPLVTTADVILGEPLKKQPGQSGKTSNNRDSDQSLISVDSSENEEEDLFQSKWKGSSVTKKLGHTESSTASGPMDSFDLNSIQKTELLVSRAAKDRILVKPKRKGTRQSHKKKDSSTSTPPLPSLNEESPFGYKAEDGHGDFMSGSPPAKSPNTGSFFDDASPPSTVSAPSHAHVPAADTRLSQGFSSTGKPTLSSITINSKYGDAGSPLASPTFKSPPATVPATAASPPSKVISPTSSSAMSPPHKSEGSSDSKPRSQSISSHFTNASSGNSDIPDKSSEVEGKKFDGSLSASERGDKSSISQAAGVTGSRLSQSHRELTDVKLNMSEAKSNTDFRSETKSNTDFRSESKSNTDFRIETKLNTDFRSHTDFGPEIKSSTDFRNETKSNTDFRTESKSNTDLKPETKSNTDFRSLMSQFQDPALASRRKSGATEIVPLKSSDSPSAVSGAAKEDVKTRREARSKTLPAAASEQSTPKVQRSSSHHAPASKSQPEHPSKDKNAAFTSSESTPLTSLLSASTKSENVTLESFDFPVTLTEELPFSFVVQKNDESHEVSPEGDAIKLSEISASKSELTTLESKSSLPSGGHLEKKRESIETVSYKNKELSEQTFKKPDIPEVRRRNVEISSASKRGSVDISSTKRDSIEIEISQLTSVRASRNLFDSGSKVSILKDSTQPTASTNSSVADRTKLYSASTSSARAVSNTGQSQTSSAISTNESTKSAMTSGSITHSRGGSVKSSPAKPAELRSTFHSRGGSIKSSLGSGQPTDPLPTVTETTPAPKHESSGSSTAPSSSQPASALHASTHITAQPNSSLPSQTPSVTPLSFSIKPFSAYTPKHATNIAPATRPASAFIQPASKHTTTPSATSAAATPTLAATSTIAAIPTLAASSTLIATSTLTATSTLAATPTLAATSTPAVANSFDFKPASSAACGKGFSISNVKTTALAYPASDISTPISLASSVSSSSPLSSSYSVTSHTTSTTISSSKSSPSSQPSSLRSHSSFTTPAALKPQITSSSSSLLSQSTRPSSIMKSPSFKATVTTSTEKLPTADKKPAETKVPATSSSVPAWRTHLTTKEVKIEIIENTPSLQPLSSSSQSRSEMLRNSSDKGKMSATVKKTESLSSSGAAVEAEKTTRRTSKVLDMVKNFQNLQAPS